MYVEMDKSHNQALNVFSLKFWPSDMKGQLFVAVFKHLSSQSNLTLDFNKLETTEALFTANLSL